MKRAIAILTAICLLAGGALVREYGIWGVAASAEQAPQEAEEVAEPVGDEPSQPISEETPAPDAATDAPQEALGSIEEPSETGEPSAADDLFETGEIVPDGGQLPEEEPEGDAGDGPAWYRNGEAKRYGALEDLVFETGEAIYICTGEVFALTGDTSAAAMTASLRPDPEVFGGSYTVYRSQDNPEGASAPGTVYIWVALEKEDPPTDPPEIEAELSVGETGYSDGVWTNAAPNYALSVIPDTLTGYAFAVSVDDGEFEPVSDASYMPTLEGTHAYRFALLDPDGTEVDFSRVYTVALDLTAPAVEAVLGRTGALSVTATDALSGIGGISFDGGETWFDMTMQEDGGYAYRHALGGAPLAAGMLVVRDAAGNRWTSDQAYAVQSSGGMGGMSGLGGSGAGSSASARTVSHASGSSSSATAYGAVALEVEEQGMNVLTVGGEELDLRLWLDTATDDSLTGEATFSAEFAVWNAAEGDESWDTLVLTAEEGDIASPYAYRWDFSGAVYKKLANSGVRYLVLRVGDRMTAISTAGFTAGERYNLLKAEGVASRAFRYSVWMGVPDPEMEMQVSVENENYLLAGDSSGEMYYYDVYTGSAEMMDVAFGAYARQE